MTAFQWGVLRLDLPPLKAAFCQNSPPNPCRTELIEVQRNKEEGERETSHGSVAEGKAIRMSSYWAILQRMIWNNGTL